MNFYEITRSKTWLGVTRAWIWRKHSRPKERPSRTDNRSGNSESYRRSLFLSTSSIIRSPRVSKMQNEHSRIALSHLNSERKNSTTANKLLRRQLLPPIADPIFPCQSRRVFISLTDSPFYTRPLIHLNKLSFASRATSLAVGIVTQLRKCRLNLLHGVKVKLINQQIFPTFSYTYNVYSNNKRSILISKISATNFLYHCATSQFSLYVYVQGV